MMNKLFGRNVESNEVVEAVAVVNEEVLSTSETVVDIAEELRSQREYIKAMEVRLHTRSEAAFNDLQKSFEQGMETAVAIVKQEVAKIGSNTRPQEVVKEIEKRTASERMIRKLNDNKTKLQSVVATYLVNDLPLISDTARYKHPQFTPQGEAVYREVMKFITQLAKITGRNKEYYTNSDVYQKFFDRFGIERYERGSVRSAKGKQMTTLMAMVIVNGHIKQYINFILSLSDEEMAKYESKEDANHAK